MADTREALRAVEEAIYVSLSPLAERPRDHLQRIARARDAAREAGANTQEIRFFCALGRRRAEVDANHVLEETADLQAAGR